MEDNAMQRGLREAGRISWSTPPRFSNGWTDEFEGFLPYGVFLFSTIPGYVDPPSKWGGKLVCIADGPYFLLV